MMTTRRLLTALLALTAAVYLPGVFLHDFVSLDDMLLILQNDKVHGLTPGNILQVFRSYDPELYVPLTLMTYQMEYTVSGLHAFLYHLDNLLLHLGSVVLVYLVMKRIIRACHAEPVEARHAPSTMSMVRQAHHDMVALFIAALFALHPLQTEAVSWAAARKDLLSGFLVLLSVLLFLQYRDSGSKRSYGWSIAIYVLALLSKVSIILIPFSILLLDLLRRDLRFRKGSMEFAPFGIAALFFGIIAMFGKTLQLKELTLVEQFLLSCKGLGFYLWKFFVPTGLTVYQPQFSPVTILAPEFIVAILIILALIVTAWTVRKRFPLFTFGLALYALSVAPSFMNFWKKGTLYFASDRYVYIGIIGIALAVVTILEPALDRLSNRTRMIGASVITVILAFGSFAQASTWKDSTALYTRALQIHPAFAVALNNLGAAQYTEGKIEEAFASYEQAVAADPTLTSGYTNLALHYRKEGDPVRAMEMIRKGLESIPEGRPAFDEEVSAWNILGLLLDERGMREESLTAYRKAVERAPESRDAHYNLAVTAQKYGLLPEAREQLVLYLELNSRDLEARYRLAAIQAELGMLPDAAKNLRIILYEDPNYENAAQHLEKITEMME